MTWEQRTIYGFDCETTGTDVHSDRIVTATMVKVEAGRHVDSRSWLIDPGIEIPPRATEVHGITTAYAREHGTEPAGTLRDIARVVWKVLSSGYPLVVFNAAYDLSLLESELARHRLPTISSLFPAQGWHTLIDPMVLVRGLDMASRSFVKGRKYRLPDLCERYGVDFVEAHDATSDAVGASLLARAILTSEPTLSGLAPGELFDLQRSWRAEDQRGFREWVQREGKTSSFADIDDGWPLHSSLSSS
ncbi:exonuclease domain-containing protein [Tessaracoccus caeni]|uniref:exonuclease domain-containing protein n=1 Tax=Tessaracoccus caeni TaxID=3031239 RepID=UPI0023DB2524|nr:exonuclease domain-containing protein [Tessaracoccus caeni]MDF1488938.1 exonuclease domain-containing protein [Tessaracoccus caeni]